MPYPLVVPVQAFSSPNGKGGWRMAILGPFRVRNGAYYAGKGLVESLDSFFTKNQAEFLQHPVVKGEPLDHYSTACALAYYLLEYDGGRHRDAVAAFARKYYQGLAQKPADLASALGVKLPELEKDWRAFLKTVEPFQ